MLQPTVSVGERNERGQILITPTNVPSERLGPHPAFKNFNSLFMRSPDYDVKLSYVLVICSRATICDTSVIRLGSSHTKRNKRRDDPKDPAWKCRSLTLVIQTK